MINTTAIPAVAITLWILGAFSAATWGLILLKAIQQVRNARGNSRFGKKFWSAPNLQAAADLSTNEAAGSSALGRIAIAGFSALNAPAHSEEHDLQHGWDRHELLQRNLGQQLKRERRTLDGGLAVLASIGSTAPFVGLFGTVWGIMSAMHDISKNGNASIDVVAGPIGEALIATGIGIAVAIPAVLAYNFFLRRLKSALGGYEDFAHDFLNLAQRATFRVERSVRPVEDSRTPLRESRGERTRDRESAPAILLGGKSA